MESLPLYVSANSFGIKRVVFDPGRNVRILLSGATRHGMQSADPARSTEPLAYYHRSGPLGDVFAVLSPAEVGIIGLGAGCIAAYSQPGQRFTFYEIDPGVTEIATDPQYFTFLSRCRGTCNIVAGDGLASLEKAEDGTFDMLILDAFADEDIPAHLVSPVALRLYLHKLADNGLLVLHITNVATPLQPELSRFAAAESWACVSRADLEVTESDRAAGRLASHYVVITRNQAVVSALTEHKGWTNG